MRRRPGDVRRALGAFAVLGALIGVAGEPARPADLHSKPPDRSGRVVAGVASFYSRKEAGKPTASGDPLALNRMTAASPTLPLGTKAKVVNTQTGKTAQVTVTDRGPHVKGRVLDVTPKAAEQLGLAKKDGLAPVQVKPISEPAPPSPQ